ncbi:acetolactate synthase small subunit [Chloroflexota bacterium]
MATKKHTLVALVSDRPGVLNRVASLFRRRGFNIDSIAVGHSETAGISRMTIVVDGNNTSVEQVRKQLDKVPDIVKLSDITGDDTVARELSLIKVRTTTGTRSEIVEIVNIFRANIVDVAADSLTIEATGDEDKIDSLFNLLRGFGIKEMARTGCIAMTRGERGALPVEDKAGNLKNMKCYSRIKKTKDSF